MEGDVGLFGYGSSCERGEEIAFDCAIKDAQFAGGFIAEDEQVCTACGEVEELGRCEFAGLQGDGSGGPEDGDARVGGKFHGDWAWGETGVGFFGCQGNGSAEDFGIGVEGSPFSPRHFLCFDRGVEAFGAFVFGRQACEGVDELANARVVKQEGVSGHGDDIEFARFDGAVYDEGLCAPGIGGVHDEDAFVGIGMNDDGRQGERPAGVGEGLAFYGEADDWRIGFQECGFFNADEGWVIEDRHAAEFIACEALVEEEKDGGQEKEPDCASFAGDD